jgi:hypothetical protein
MIVLAAVATGCAGQSPAAPTTLIGDRHAGLAGVESAAPAAFRSAATTDSTQTRAPITFTLSGCPNLPAGLTVVGSGEDFLVVNSRLDADGVTHIERDDLTTGTATDSNDASYKFNYHNHSNITIPSGGLPLVLYDDRSFQSRRQRTSQPAASAFRGARDVLRRRATRRSLNS